MLRQISLNKFIIVATTLVVGFISSFSVTHADSGINQFVFAATTTLGKNPQTVTVRDPLVFKTPAGTYILEGTPRYIIEYPGNTPADLVPEKGKPWLTQIFGVDGVSNLRILGYPEWEKVFFNTPSGLKMTASLPQAVDFSKNLLTTASGTRKTYVFIPSTSVNARKTDSGFPLDWKLETGAPIINSFTNLPFVDTDGNQYSYTDVNMDTSTHNADCLAAHTMDSSFKVGPAKIILCPGLAVSTKVDPTGWDRNHPLPQEQRDTDSGAGHMENPFMYHSPDGKYYVVYSAGSYQNITNYGGVMAICDTPMGPCQKVMSSDGKDSRTLIAGGSTNYYMVGRPFPVLDKNGFFSDLIFHARASTTDTTKNLDNILRCQNAAGDPTFLEDFAHGGPSCDYDGTMETLPINPSPLTTGTTASLTSQVKQLDQTVTGGAPSVATVVSKNGVKSELLIKTNQTVDGVLSSDGKYRTYSVMTFSGDISGTTWQSLGTVLSRTVTADKRLNISGFSLYQATDSTIYLAYHEQFSSQMIVKDPVWSNFALKVLKSTDLGKTWIESPAVTTINNSPNLGVSDPFITEVSKRPNKLQVYFTHERQIDPTCSTDKNLDTASDIYLRESFDNGATWQNPRIALSRGVSREAKPSVAELPDGSLLMAFETARDSSCGTPDQTPEIGLATSNNGGMNWTYLPHAISQTGEIYNTDPSLVVAAGKQVLLRFATNAARVRGPIYRSPWTEQGATDARVIISTNIPTALSAPVWNQTPVTIMKSARAGKINLMGNLGMLVTGNDAGFDRAYYRTFSVASLNDTIGISKPNLVEVTARITNAITATGSPSTGVSKKPTKLLLADGTVINADAWFPLTKNGAFINDNIDIGNIPGSANFEGLIIDRIGNGAVRIGQVGKNAVKFYYMYTDAQLEVQNAQFDPAGLFGVGTDPASSTLKRNNEDLSRFDYYSLVNPNTVKFGFYTITGWDQINVKVVSSGANLGATIVSGQTTTDLQNKLVQLLQLLQTLLSLQKK